MALLVYVRDDLATDARLVAKKPASLSFREAAAVPLVGITAWLALVDRARLAPSDHVLVHAGAGGVGHVAVQIAKAVGARVATTVSTSAKRDLVDQLGANEVIMYRDEAVEDYVNRLTAGRGFDVVFDTVGGDNVERSMQAARVSGHVLGIALRTDANLALIHQKNLTLSGVFMVLGLLHRDRLDQFREILETLSRWADEGMFRPVLVDRRFTLDQVGEAHALLEAGGITGKVVQDKEPIIVPCMAEEKSFLNLAFGRKTDELKDLSFEEVAKSTTENAIRLFKLEG